MRIVRVGGGWLANREAYLWTAICAVVLAVLVAAAISRDAFVAGATVMVGLVIARPIGRRLLNVRKGRLGERLITDLLRRLPDDYLLVNDVVVPGMRGNADHVLIGPCGVLVIETKRLAGKIRCDGDIWYVKDYRRRSISRQVNAGAAAVRRFLSSRHQDIGFVESVVVFTHPLCQLEVKRPKTIVVRYSELLQLVLDLAKRNRMRPGLAEELARSLHAGEDIGSGRVLRSPLRSSAARPV